MTDDITTLVEFLVELIKDDTIPVKFRMRIAMKLVEIGWGKPDE